MGLKGVPVDRIRAEARQIRFTRTVLTVVAGVLYGAGWLAGRLCAAVWAVVAWSAAAVKVGWREAVDRGREAG